ncbi:MAG: hypothetical protein ABIN68_01935 [Sphingomicrobium sp.]
MRFAIAALAAALLLSSGPGRAQDADLTPERAAAASRDPSGKPSRPASQPGTSQPGTATPKADQKLLIDLVNRLTRPGEPAPPRPPAVPQPVEPAAPVSTAPAPPPTAIPPPPRSRPGFALPTSVAGPRTVQPRPAPAPQPPPRAPVVVAQVAPQMGTPEPNISAAAEPALPTPPAPPVRQSSAAKQPAVPPAQRSSSLLSQSPWLLLALLAAASAVVARLTWSRARQIARTRAALSLEPRLDLAQGSCSAGSLALACPPMTIRSRLEFAGA